MTDREILLMAYGAFAKLMDEIKSGKQFIGGNSSYVCSETNKLTEDKK